MRGTVLVIDDDPGVRQSLGEFLEAEGYKVLIASHGREALAVLEEELPHVLLIDVAMPVMSGWKLVEALSHYPDLARIPRILMSEHDDVDGTLRRPFRIAEKPLNHGWLSSAIATLVGRPAPVIAAA
jgi:CheY-like chemotaxis protein